MSEANGEFTVDPEYVFDDIEPKLFYVKVRKKYYVLKSADTNAAVKFRNAFAQAAKVGGTPGDIKVTGFAGVAGVEPMLVQMCMFEVIKQANGTYTHGPVSLTWVLGLPPEVTSLFYDKIIELSPNIRGVGTSRTKQPAEGNTADDAEEQVEEESLPKG